MHILRYFLFPFSVLYGAIVLIRNYMYDIQFLKSKTYNFPLIVIGNLSVGGTGKTPMTAYMLKFLKEKYSVGMLSRGYKRKSEGFYVANERTTVEEIGDEPFQLFSNFPDAIIAVDADRRNGIQQLQNSEKLPEVLLLDDAYQHRKVQAGYYVLLTTFDSLFVDDFMLPTGNLRDTKNQAKRAACIVITKCPEGITEKDKERVITKLKPEAHQKVYFTSISYGDKIVGKAETLYLNSLQNLSFTLVTGIAKPTYLVNYLKEQNLQFEHLSYPDHHNFSDNEIAQLRKKEMIITTEKDYVRLQNKLNNIYYLPIETSFLGDEELFQRNLITFIDRFHKN
ncbi:lipid-A-disaccharide kinase [Pustulibacterium marinum]|uniref:Tetraacyldisaccharide 4'-kinase n=1 Tax=Pustulibacterium marinum TaxID=1224947 RepID=A0A1I7HNM1_9FLAO|nr:tetraacyldisaccharide 4'-kinase [Pustulibacterium marinum]SFU62298.1 lipid-A-disaccharide kinase [Pustulibacterium marinum]